MGWSCSTRAGDVYDFWMEKCIKSSGKANVYIYKDKTYVIERSNKEWIDGSISGSIMLVTKDCGTHFEGKKVGSFKIDGNGYVYRAPAFFLKK